MRKFFIVAAYLVICSVYAGAADSLHSVGDGAWNAPSTWDLGVVPSSWTVVTITHTVTYNQNSADVSCSSITVDSGGVLQFDAGVSSRSLILGGHLDIKSGGQFLMPPNDGYESILELRDTYVTNSRVYVRDGGIFNVSGSSLAYWKTTLASVANNGSLSIAITDSTGWKVGDQLLIEPDLASGRHDVRTISAINGTDITLTGTLTYSHISGAEVVNLTRNCKIVNGEPDVNYPDIENYSTTPGNFDVAWTEFSWLRYPAYFNGYPTQGSFKYNSVVDSSWGVYLNNAEDSLIENNVFHNTRNTPIRLYSAQNNYISGNSISYSGSYGINMFTMKSISNTYVNNSIYGNQSYGIYGSTWCEASVFKGNRIVNNDSTGLYITRSDDLRIENNIVDSNIILGTDTGDVSSNNFIKNNQADIYIISVNNSVVVNNTGTILKVKYSDGNIIFNNTISGGSSEALALGWSENNNIVQNEMYSSQTGILLSGMNSRNTSARNSVGVKGSNTLADIEYESLGINYSTLFSKGDIFASPTFMDMQEADESAAVAVFSPGESSSSVKVYGDLELESGEILKANYTDNLFDAYASDANAVNTYLSGGSISTITVSNAKTQTEFWALECFSLGPDKFSVKRGTDSYEVVDGTATEGVEYESTDRGVKFTIGSAGYSVGDSFYFVTVSSSADSNVPKSIAMYEGPLGATITVKNGAELQIKGTESNPTVVSPSGSFYWSLDVDGTFEASHYNISYLTSKGMNFTSNANIVDLSSGTIDYIEDNFFGSGGSAERFFTFDNLTCDATFYYVNLQDSLDNYKLSARADGPGVNITFYNSIGDVDGKYYSGFGSNNEAVTNGATLSWPEDMQPGAVTGLSGESIGHGVQLSWVASGDNGSEEQIVGGFYGISFSTYVINWSTNNLYSYYYYGTGGEEIAPGETFIEQTFFENTALEAGVTYYFRVFIADEMENWSEISDGATVCVKGEPLPITDFTAARASDYGFIDLSWTYPEDLSAGSEYLIQYATSASTQWSYNDAQIAVSTQVTGGTVQNETVSGLAVRKDSSNNVQDYYFRLWINNQDGIYSELPAGATDYPTSPGGVRADTVLDDGWVRSFDDQYHNLDVLTAVDSDAAGNIYSAGYTPYFDGVEMLIEKHDSDGNRQWSTFYNNPANSDDYLYDLAVNDADGNIYVAGSVDRTDLGRGKDMFVGKFSSSGHLVWSKTYDSPGSSDDEAYGITADAGGVYAAGAEKRDDAGENWNSWVRKYNLDGTTVWTSTFNNTSNSSDTLKAVAVSGTDVYAAGYEYISGEGNNLVLMKLDSSSDGAMVWKSTYNSAGNLDDAALDLSLDASGNIIIAGYEDRTDQGRGKDALLIKYDSSGNIIWSKTTADTVSSEAHSVVASGDNIYFAGTKASDIGVGRYSSTGDLIWISTTTEGYAYQVQANGIAAANAGLLYIAGYDDDGNGDTVLRKLDQSVISVPAISAAARTNDSVTFGWTDSNYESTYTVKAAGGAQFAELQYNTLSYSISGLGLNKSTSIYVTAYNEWGSTDSAVFSAYSEAAAPSSLTVTETSTNSVSISWAVNSNPAYTRWNIIRSVDGFASTETVKAFAHNYTSSTYVDSDILSKTTYWYKVRAYNEDEATTAYTSAVSTSIPDFIPPGKVTGLSAAASSTSKQFTLTWTAPGDDEYSGDVSSGAWQINFSTDASATADTAENTFIEEGVAYNAGALTGKNIAVLTQESTYYFWIRAKDNAGNWGEWSDAASDYLDDVTGPAAVDDLNARPGTADGQVDLTWSCPGDDGSSGNLTGAFRIDYATYTKTWNMAVYETEFAATDHAPGVDINYTADSLTLGVTYYFVMWSQDDSGNWSDISNSTSSLPFVETTPPAAVTVLASPGVSTGTIALSWTTPGDDGNTGSISGGKYNIQYATFNTVWAVADAQVSNSTSVAAGIEGGHILTGLTAGASYYIKVWYADEHLNWSPPSNTGVAYANIDPPSAFTSFTGAVLSTTSIKWTWSDVERESKYLILDVYDNIKQELPADTTYWVETGLQPSWRNSYHVKALNNAGSTIYPAAGAESEFTYPVEVGGIYFSNVSSSAIQLNWNANGNWTLVRYGLLRSTDNFSTSTTTVIDYGGKISETNYNDTGLADDTTYWYKIISYNGSQGDEAHSSVVSTTTLPTLPAAPSGLKNIDSTETTITWEWNDNSDNEDGFKIYDSADDSLKKTVSANATSTTEAGLQPSVRYERYVAAYNEAGSSTSSATGYYTLANKPVNVSVVPSSNSVTVSWDTNSNPSVVRWYVIRSTDDFATSTASVSGYLDNAVTQYTDAGLSPTTTYYYKVASRNSIGNLNYSGSVSTVTLEGPPGVVTGFTDAAVSSTSIQWTWDDTDIGETQYNIYSSTGGLLTTKGRTAFSWTETGLDENTAYTRYVRGYNAIGEGAACPAVEKFTLANTPVSLTAASAGPHSIQLSWSSSGTRFRIDKSTDSVNWQDYKLWNSGITQTSYTADELLSDTTYYFAVYAYNGEGVVSVSSVTANAKTDVLLETVVSSSSDAQQTESKTYEGKQLDFTVGVTGGAVAEDYYLIITPDPLNAPREADKTVIQNAVNKIKAQAKFHLLEYACSEYNLYDLTGKRITGNFSNSVSLTLPYLDENNDGIVDGTGLKEEQLKIYALNESSQEWVLIGGNVNTVNNAVTASVNHFSVYALIGENPAANDLSSVIAYPVPYDPADGDMTFDNLTSDVEIKLYTIAGELVVSLEETSGDGKVTWDGNNSGGKRVASGVYLALIKTDGETKIVKIAVQK